MNSSKTSMTRCKNSRTNNGSISVDTGDKNKRLELSTEKSTVGGLTFERCIKEGLGVGCSR